jgi:hypothetical protein
MMPVRKASSIQPQIASAAEKTPVDAGDAVIDSVEEAHAAEDQDRQVPHHRPKPQPGPFFRPPHREQDRPGGKPPEKRAISAAIQGECSISSGLQPGGAGTLWRLAGMV